MQQSEAEVDARELELVALEDLELHLGNAEGAQPLLGGGIVARVGELDLEPAAREGAVLLEHVLDLAAQVRQVRRQAAGEIGVDHDPVLEPAEQLLRRGRKAVLPFLGEIPPGEPALGDDVRRDEDPGDDRGLRDPVEPHQVPFGRHRPPLTRAFAAGGW